MSILKAETIQKYKGKSVANLLKIAEKYFNLYIRLRDTDEYGCGKCISSGQSLRIPSANAHAGHFYPKTVSRLRFDEFNVNLQGKSDNFFKSGNQLEYRKNLIRKIGIERVEGLDLISSNKTPFKWDKIAVISIIEEYKGKSSELKSNKMFKI